jgi:hypothetical protein
MPEEGVEEEGVEEEGVEDTGVHERYVLETELRKPSVEISMPLQVCLGLGSMGEWTGGELMSMMPVTLIHGCELFLVAERSPASEVLDRRAQKSSARTSNEYACVDKFNEISAKKNIKLFVSRK